MTADAHGCGRPGFEPLLRRSAQRGCDRQADHMDAYRQGIMHYPHSHLAGALLVQPKPPTVNALNEEVSYCGLR